MTPRDLYLDLVLAGHPVQADHPEPGKLWIGNPATLTDGQRALIREHRDGLLAHARQANATEEMQAETESAGAGEDGRSIGIPIDPPSDPFPYGANNSAHPDGDAADLLAWLRGHGFSLAIHPTDREKLLITGPLVDRDRAKVKANKAALLHELEIEARHAEEAKHPTPFLCEPRPDGDAAGAAGIPVVRVAGDDVDGVEGNPGPATAIGGTPGGEGGGEGEGRGAGLEAASAAGPGQGPGAEPAAGVSPAPLYRGYLRLDGEPGWSFVCQAPFRECWDELARLRPPGNCEKAVLPLGMGPAVLPSRKGRK